MTRVDLSSSNVVQLSQKLLGYKLCSNVGGEFTSGIIVETEAYRAPEDKASHAYNGRRTNRTETMFREGGISYVYMCYGIHHMFNIVTGPPEIAHAILVRAVQPEVGIETMKTRRGTSVQKVQLTNGPGKLCQAMGITRALDGVHLNKAWGNVVWLEPGIEIAPSDVVPAKRIGIDYAGEWKEKLWRFYINGNLHVSVINHGPK